MKVRLINSFVVFPVKSFKWDNFKKESDYNLNCQILVNVRPMYYNVLYTCMSRNILRDFISLYCEKVALFTGDNRCLWDIPAATCQQSLEQELPFDSVLSTVFVYATSLLSIQTNRN